MALLIDTLWFSAAGVVLCLAACVCIAMLGRTIQRFGPWGGPPPPGSE